MQNKQKDSDTMDVFDEKRQMHISYETDNQYKLISVKNNNKSIDKNKS